MLEMKLSRTIIKDVQGPLLPKHHPVTENISLAKCKLVVLFKLSNINSR